MRVNDNMVRDAAEEALRSNGIRDDDLVANILDDLIAALEAKELEADSLEEVLDDDDDEDEDDEEGGVY